MKTLNALMFTGIAIVAAAILIGHEALGLLGAVVIVLAVFGYAVRWMSEEREGPL